MVALPFGAAIYVRFPNQINSVLSLFFPLGLFYLLIGNILLLKWSVVYNPFFLALLLKNFVFYNFIYSISGLVVFAPICIIVGIMEMHLYQALSDVAKNTRWISYLLGILGLLAGVFIHACLLPNPTPFWVGALLLLLFLTYCAMPPLYLQRKTILIVLAIFLLLLKTNLFVRDPIRDLKQVNKSFVILETKVDQWGRNNRLTIAGFPKGGRLFGFYNSLFHWNSYLSDNLSHSLGDSFVASLLPVDATIAVLGVGGGAQLRSFLISKPHKIYAVDIVPNLFNTMIKLGVKTFNDPRVKLILQDGRKFIKQSNEQFDLIYLPGTESGFTLSKSLFEPSHMLFTLEAINTYREKLKPKGIIAILKTVTFTKYSPFLKNYISTFKKAGFEVNSYADNSNTEILLIASRDVQTSMRVTQASEKFQFIHPKKIDIGNPGKIISDDKPFYASVIYSDRIFFLMWFPMLSWAIVIWVFLKRFSLSSRLLLSPLLCGINYTLILLTFQLMLFFQISNPLDAAILGNVFFLTLIWLGALVYEKKYCLGFLFLFCLIISFLFKIPYPWLLLLIVAICSGGFFPRLLYHYRDKLSILLILDGLGAAIAGIIYFLIPTFLGIHALLFSLFAVFMLTLYCIRAWGCGRLAGAEGSSNH